MSDEDFDEPTSVQGLVDSALKGLLQSETAHDGTEDTYRKALDIASETLYQSILDLSCELADQDRGKHEEFVSRNHGRWGTGFDLLRIFCRINIDAGEMFQAEVLKHDQFREDPLVSVLLRLHAHACRVFGEITTLLEAGYPDGAFARWRSLHEIAVTAIVLRENGSQAAEDYRLYGVIQAIAGMNSFQETAAAMGREEYTQEELEAANNLRARILSERGDDDFRSRNGWARRYIGSSKFPSLQRAAGLENWRADYKLASRDIHTDYREMGSLLAMAEAKTDILVCGQSNSGVAEPAHSAAITLLQTTSTLVLAHSEGPECPINYTTSVVLSKVLALLSAEIGRVFLDLHETSKPAVPTEQS